MENRVLYVANLPFDTQEDEMRQAFNKYGEIVRISMVNYKDTGRFRGICFVEMNSAKAAEKALELNGGEFGGREIYVKYANPPAPKRREFYVRGNS